jgi:hypothetical protein
MSIERTGQPATNKPKLFKSKKELVVLAVSATVFAFVIYKMYLSKRVKGPEVAELNDEVVAAVPATGPAPSPAPDTPAAPGHPVDPEELLARIEADTLAAKPPPAALGRDPFGMTAAMRDHVFGRVVKAPPVRPTKTIITLTGKESRQALAAIPGAEEAAKAGLTLNAVMQAGGARFAVVNGNVVRVGGTVLGFTLTEIGEDSVLLRLGTHRVRVLLRTPG